MDKRKEHSYDLDNWRFALDLVHFALIDNRVSGGQIYKQAFHLVQNIFLTRVERNLTENQSRSDEKIECDTYLDMVDDSKLDESFDNLDEIACRNMLGEGAFIGHQVEKDYRFEFQIWARK